MRTILKGLFVIVCVVLSSVISGMISGEILKDKFVLEARNAFPAGFTDMERNSTGVHLFVKNSVDSSSGSVSGVSAKEMQISLHNKITEGTTEQTLAFTLPVRDVAFSMPSARMLPEINMAIVPEKKSSYKVFSSVVKKMRGILKTGDTDEQIGSQLIVKDEEELKISSSIAVTTEISQTFKGEVVWDDNTTIAEDGRKVRRVSEVAWEVVDEEEETLPKSINHSTSTKKLGEFTLQTVKEKEFISTKPTAEKKDVVPLVANTNTEKKASVAANVSTVHIANRSLKKMNRMLIVHEVAATYEKEDLIVGPGEVQPIRYGEVRVDGKVYVYTRLVLRVKVYTGWFIFRRLIVDQVEEFYKGEDCLWYFNGERMVKTKDLSSLPVEKR